MDKNGNPYYYIYIDAPEHITTIDTLNADSTNTLAMFKDLQPGTYTVFEYHHKAIKDAVGVDGYPFSSDIKLFYNAVFYNDNVDNLSNLKINKFGLSYYGAAHDWDITRTWTWYNEAYSTDNIDEIVQSSNKLWVSDFDSVEDDILLSDNDNMGYMWLMMEFEVTSGTVNFATMAQANDSDFTSENTSNLKASFSDRAAQVIKGKGEFAQTIESSVMEYYIDDSVSDKTNLAFSMNTVVPNNDAISYSFATNASPLYYATRLNTPLSSSLGLEYYTNYYDKTLDTDEQTSAKEFEEFLGTTNMQGYGVTYAYNIQVTNLGNHPRAFVFHAELNRGYNLKCYVDGNLYEEKELYEGEDVDKKYTGNVFAPIEIPDGETVTIRIESTEFAGANATNVNEFIIEDWSDINE